MTEPSDVDRLLEHVADTGLRPVEPVRGWNHMGALICDAALQRRVVYKTTVLPRVKRLVEEWPNADTLTGFKRLMAADSLAEVIRWQGRQKLTVIEKLVNVFEIAGIETVDDLAVLLDDELCGHRMRELLLGVDYVGSKTVDYISVLAGLTDHVAVDTHIKRFVREAGIPYWNHYARVSELVSQVATRHGCSTGALDHAIWTYMSSRTR